MDESPNDPRSEQAESNHADGPVDGSVNDQAGDQADGHVEGLEVSSEGLTSRRSASVRFAREQRSDTSSNQIRMDAANQSLADALRITYGFLQVGMVVLLILFVFSGFQKINEGERGISVFLGKPSSSQLEPGAHLTWPYPIGELIRVGVGAIEVPLARDFMPNMANRISDESMLEAPIEQFSNAGSLSPVRDNSLITADLNIAHTQWTVNYHRSNHLRYVKNMLPENERLIIIIAARRGVVQTIAETTIDDLLKKSAESIAARVRSVAQQTLDDLESGITIDRVVLVRKTPPLYLLDRFASVQSAAQNAGKAREDALLKRDQSLNQVAGRAAPVLISMIEEYERDIELDETAKGEALLSQIDTVFAGGEVNYKGTETLALISGEVSEILNEAQAKASTRISQSIADLELFRAKQQQFEANPRLMIARDWSLAMNEFLNKDFVSTMYLPEGVDAELLVNHDPDIERERDRLRKRKEAVESMIQRREDLTRDLYKSQRGIAPEDEQ